MVKDYYFILEVDANADLGAIKTSYRRLAKKYHPDLNPSHDAQERMKALTEAYGVLSDANKRALYDRKRAPRPPAYSNVYTTPPPRTSRHTPRPEIIISESMVTDALRLSKVNLILSSALLQRRLGLDYDQAAKLFSILIKRGFVDEDGRWTAKAKHASSAKATADARKKANKKGPGDPRPSGDPSPRAKPDEFRITEAELLEAIEISKTNYMLTVGVLQSRMRIDSAKAHRLYDLLGKRGYIDDIGVWTDEARNRAKGRTRPSKAHAAPERGPAANGKTKAPDEKIVISEALIADAVKLSHGSLILTMALLKRRLNIGHAQAVRLFEILVERGYVDETGEWQVGKSRPHPAGGHSTGRHSGGGNPANTNGKPASEPSEAAADAKAHTPTAPPTPGLEAFTPEALKLLRTEKALTVEILQHRLSIGFNRASALLQMLVEEGVIDRAGKPTAQTKTRLATKDLGTVFDCPFCHQDKVHHYETPRRFLPAHHYFKCPKCLTEFAPAGKDKYKLSLVPTPYAAVAKPYLDRSLTAAEWQEIGTRHGKPHH